MNRMIELAQSFFSRTIGVERNEIAIKEVSQENSIVNFDLMYKGYELGSYGIRRFKNLSQWVYGTGCAEPRLSLIQKI